MIGDLKYKVTREKSDEICKAIHSVMEHMKEEHLKEFTPGDPESLYRFRAAVVEQLESMGIINNSLEAFVAGSHFVYYLQKDNLEHELKNIKIKVIDMRNKVPNPLEDIIPPDCGDPRCPVHGMNGFLKRKGERKVH